MPSSRPPKKSDPLVVRMPRDAKDAFLEACRRNGRTASAVVRELIDGYVVAVLHPVEAARGSRARRALRAILSSPRIRFAGAASAAAGALAFFALSAAPSAAELDFAAAFAALDANDDGRVTIEEFSPPGVADGSAVLVVRAAAQGRIGIGRFGEPGGAPIAEYWLPNAASAEPAVTSGMPEPGDLDWLEELRRNAFAGFDLNEDGTVDFAEFEARHQGMIALTFRTLDSDLDGVVTPEEFDAPVAYEVTAPAGAASDASAALSTEAFLRLDHDRDGAISAAEFELGPDG
jgi:Ca2+-binding EF-hand superfamily protein